MKRGFNRGVSGRALLAAVLCLFLLPATAGATSYVCEPREARVLFVENDQWRSDLTATSPTGASVRLTDCAGLSFMTADLAPGGAVAMEDFAARLCSPARVVGVAHLPVKSGCASLATEATYTDPLGNFNVVSIPELPAPLEEHSDTYLFTGIRSGAPRSTFVLLVAEGGLTRARVTLLGHDAGELGDDVVPVGSSGWAWYEITTPVSIGSVSVRNIGPGVGIGSPAKTQLYAYAFSGYAGGGSPREIAPERVVDLTPSR